MFDSIKNKVKSHVRFQLKAAKYGWEVGQAVKLGLTEEEIIKKFKFEGKTITVVRNDLAAVAVGPIPAAFVLKQNGNYIIVVNTLWKAQPKPVREAILAHELGHIHHGHLENMTIPQGITNNIKRLMSDPKQVQKEIEADRYACENGHKHGLYNFFVIAQEMGLPQSKELSLRKRVVNGFKKTKY